MSKNTTYPPPPIKEGLKRYRIGVKFEMRSENWEEFRSKRLKKFWAPDKEIFLFLASIFSEILSQTAGENYGFV